MRRTAETAHSPIGWADMIRMHQNRLRFLLGCLAVMCVALPQGRSLGQPYTEAQRESLKAVQVILVAGRERSVSGMPETPYQIGMRIKLKLEQAGYRVVLDPQEAHDAVLLVEYQEVLGREYPTLERGTKITCGIALHHPAVGKLFSYNLEAETSWPRPFGSLYWDAVQNLEENPYYYYLAELVRGWLTRQADSVDVFSTVLRQAPLHLSMDGSDEVVTPRVAANLGARLNAIHELGTRRDARALETLWTLVWQNSTVERKAAIAAIGEIGDPSSAERLTDLANSEAPSPIRAAAAAALARIRASH